MFSNKVPPEKQKNGGYSLIELILVMALLVVFGLTTFTLVVSGSEAYKNIIYNKNANSELRVALSYINMRVRQNDFDNGISIKQSPFGNGSAIVTQEIIDNDTYETWIFWEQDKLREALVKQGEPVTVDTSFVISDIDGFDVEYTNDKKSIEIKVWRIDKGAKTEYNSLLFLKSAL